MTDHRKYLEDAIEEAFKGMRAGEGGPFGAVIVRDGRVIGKGHNSVLKSHDPTAHAEINAIRHACGAVANHHLTGAVIYTNFEPCPMCLGAIYWADIRSLFYCADREEAEKIGFMDRHLYEEIVLPAADRELEFTRVEVPLMARLLEEWNRKEGKIFY
ncbi:MAG TPA: nucleoside deaminase [Bacteroides sp.]|nr:nucleoside deaminase [Bacteroides sp.]